MTADPQRRAELAAIHVAVKQLALAEDSYRGLVGRFSGGRTESAGGLTQPERRRLLDHFRHLGFLPKPANAPGRRRGAPIHEDAGVRRRRDGRPHAAKLRALWISLWQLGVVSQPSEPALAAFLKRQTGLEAMQFADVEAFNLAIECLKQWCARVGYTAVPFNSSAVAFNSLPPPPQEGSFAPGLITAQWDRLARLGAFRTGGFARLDTWLARMGFAVAAPQFLTPDQAQEVIDTLGKWLRRVTSPEDGDG